MKTIVLISCVKKKRGKRSKAEELYISPFFKKNLAYAKSLKPDKIFILSAKYGLLNLHDEIDPYEMTLNAFSSGEIKEWAERTLKQLEKEASLSHDRFIILAGENYRKYLLPAMRNYDIPMEGLSIGRQLQYLNKAIG
ncbi:MAG: hypothetical protein K9J25_11310 [Bacteroidales bacterium]|nr:hypothetical protein [Bacteroidales bacterium]